jgi:hypothetical protein
MTCLGQTCEYWKEPETTFTWLYTDVQETIRCKISTRQIVMDQSDQAIGLGINGPCKVVHGHCRFPSGSLYWRYKQAVTCPFELAGKVSFRETNGKLIATGR